MSFSFSDGSLRLPNLCQYHQNVLQHYYQFYTLIDNVKQA